MKPKSKHKKIVLILVLVGLINILPVSGQTLEWTQYLNHEGYFIQPSNLNNATDQCNDITSDETGIYIVGVAHYDQGYYYSQSGDSFLTKYDRNGNLQHDKRLSFSNTEYDTLYNVETINQTLILQGAINNPYQADTSFLSTYNTTTKTYIIKHQYTGSKNHHESINTITTYQKHVYACITEWYIERNTFGTITDTWSNPRIIKLDHKLNQLETINIPHKHKTNNWITDIKVDQTGITLAGEFNAPYPGHSSSINLIKIGHDGTHQWNTSIQDQGPKRSLGVSSITLNQEHIYVTGITSQIYPDNTWEDANYYLAKYLPNGTQKWNTTITTAPRTHSFQTPRITTTQNHLAITWGIQGTIHLATYDKEGKHQWNTTWGNQETVKGTTTINNEIYITGTTLSHLDGSGHSDIFTQKYQDTTNIQATIDIKPGETPNPVNPKSRGKLPVAIHTTQNLDITNIDPTTVKLAKASPIRWNYEDTDNDQDQDLTLYFKTRELDINQDTEALNLTGYTYNGQYFTGTDTIQIKPPKNNKRK